MVQLKLCMDVASYMHKICCVISRRTLFYDMWRVQTVKCCSGWVPSSLDILFFLSVLGWSCLPSCLLFQRSLSSWVDPVRHFFCDVDFAGGQVNGSLSRPCFSFVVLWSTAAVCRGCLLKQIPFVLVLLSCLPRSGLLCWNANKFCSVSSLWRLPDVWPFVGMGFCWSGPRTACCTYHIQSRRWLAVWHISYCRW